MNQNQDPTQNSGVKSTLIDTNPEDSLEKSRNATEGKSHNAAGGTAASTAEEHIPSNSDPNATDLPTAR